MSEPENFNYKLSKPLAFTPSNSGAETETYEIQFLPPSFHCLYEASAFKQHIHTCFSAAQLKIATAFSLDSEKIAEIQEAEKAKAQTADVEMPKMTAKLVLNYIFQVSPKESHTKELLESFFKLAYKVGMLDGKTSLKPTHFERIEFEDIWNMLGEYGAVFMPPSLQ